MASGPSQLESVVIGWFRQWFGLPDGAGGLMTSGGSAAALHGLVAAREAAGNPDRAVAYMSDQSHGAQVRAARIVGIDVSKVCVIVFALCIGITGAVGALVSPVLAVQPFQGPPLTLKAFAITAMAGLGSIRGALGGAMVLGLVEAGLAVYVEGVGTDLAVVASLVILVAAVVLRPQGLFGGVRPVDAPAA